MGAGLQLSSLVRGSLARLGERAAVRRILGTGARSGGMVLRVRGVRSVHVHHGRALLELHVRARLYHLDSMPVYVRCYRRRIV